MTTKPFRWSSINSDLALAREVSNCRPQKPVDWEDVAHRLSSYFGSDEKPVKLTGRGCTGCPKKRGVLVWKFNF